MQIRHVSYDDPDAARLIAEVQQEYVHRYGGADTTPVTVAEFTPRQDSGPMLSLVDTQPDGVLTLASDTPADEADDCQRMVPPKRPA